MKATAEAESCRRTLDFGCFTSTAWQGGSTTLSPRLGDGWTRKKYGIEPQRTGLAILPAQIRVVVPPRCSIDERRRSSAALSCRRLGRRPQEKCTEMSIGCSSGPEKACQQIQAHMCVGIRATGRSIREREREKPRTKMKSVCQSVGHLVCVPA